MEVIVIADGLIDFFLQEQGGKPSSFFELSCQPADPGDLLLHVWRYAVRQAVQIQIVFIQ